MIFSHLTKAAVLRHNFTSSIRFCHKLICMATAVTHRSNAAISAVIIITFTCMPNMAHYDFTNSIMQIHPQIVKYYIFQPFQFDISSLWYLKLLKATLSYNHLTSRTFEWSLHHSSEYFLSQSTSLTLALLLVNYSSNIVLFPHQEPGWGRTRSTWAEVSDSACVP